MTDTPRQSQTVPAWADLLSPEVTPPWQEFRRPFLDHIITTAPVPAEAAPLTLADMRAAMDRVLALPYTRDRYVIPDSRWHRIMTEASPDLQRDLESLRANGTVIVSSMLPDDIHAYRITLPEDIAPAPRWFA